MLLKSRQHPLTPENDEQLAAAGVPAGLVRISCGLEDKKDLIADLAQALAAIE